MPSPRDSIPENTSTVTRRQVISAGIVAASGAVVAQAVGRSAKDEESSRKGKGNLRQPVVFLPHGGGPWPFVDLGFESPQEHDDLIRYLRGIPRNLPSPPKAVLMISAHWEEKVPMVMTSPKPPMLYDYFGFPPESYTVTWPAPGDAALAARVRQLLKGAGIASEEDDRRGFDHGTFVPMKVAFPDARIPTVQLSLMHGLDPSAHLALGRALAPLRDEGVLILGSGMTYHNLRMFGPRGIPVAEAFDAWLRGIADVNADERARRLIDWQSAPFARAAHPREEHLLPLMVAAGAAGDDPATVAWNGTFAGLRLSAYRFG